MTPRQMTAATPTAPQRLTLAEVVETAPPLTAEQVDRLRQLLPPATKGRANAEAA